MYELPKNLLNNLRFGNFDIKNGYENLTITLNSAWKPFIENSTLPNFGDKHQMVYEYGS